MKKALDELQLNNYKRLAHLLVKYQRFKTSVIVKQIYKEIPSLQMGSSTVNNYINYSVAYLKYGTKSTVLPQFFYGILDEQVKECVQPLIPRKDEERLVHARNYTKKNITLPITKELEKIAPKLTGKFIYGLQVDNRILTFEHEADMNKFLDNLKYISDAKFRKVTVEVEDYE